MPTNIVVPSFGESITEGTIAQWLKKEGDYVSKDEILVEVESEKATQGIPSPAAGVLHPKVKAGDKIEVGGILGTIDESAAAPVAKPAGEQREPAGSKPKEEPKLSPAARRVATEQGADSSKIAGTGRHGVILKEDVKPPKPAAEQRGPAGAENRVPMSAIRARIAERLVTSQKSTASLTTFNEIDMSAVMDLRSRYKDKFKEKHAIHLGFMSFFVKASVEALKAFPNANAMIDGRDIVYHNAYHVGVAVSTDK